MSKPRRAQAPMKPKAVPPDKTLAESLRGERYRLRALRFVAEFDVLDKAGKVTRVVATEAMGMLEAEIPGAIVEHLKGQGYHPTD